MAEALLRLSGHIASNANGVLACHFDEITSRNWLNYTSTMALTLLAAARTKRTELVPPQSPRLDS